MEKIYIKKHKGKFVGWTYLNLRGKSLKFGTAGELLKLD